VPLDRIVSLAVALAEAPRTCVFFLGSGVSRDAGVPTGGEIMREGLRRLHQVETVADEPATDAVLDAWLVETGRVDVTYSDLLAEIAPDPAVRREYLAGFFEDAHPAHTHELLADLAVRGLVRVFVTTNFDRLLERALQARGIDPVVIASDAALAAAVPREHAGCYVLKPHGDVLQQTLRNTPEELENLDPGMAAELAEVFARNGLVVLGYSGQDAGIARLLRERVSRYGLWWVTRGALGEPAAALVETAGGRVIARDGAAEFLADLKRRIAVFEEHPTGETPATVHDATRSLVQGDIAALEEAMRRERHWFTQAVIQLLDDAHALGPPSEELLPAAYELVRPVLERRLASLLPLGLYDSDQFSTEIEEIARALERTPTRAGTTYVMWAELPRWMCARICYLCGAVLVRLGRIGNLGPLLRTKWRNANSREENLVWLISDVGPAMGKALLGGNWMSPEWEQLKVSLEPLGWLTERYPELTAPGEPARSLGQFDVLVAASLGINDHRALAYFAVSGDGPAEFARRVHADGRLQSQLLPVMELAADELLASMAAAVRAAMIPGSGFGNFSAEPTTIANLIQFGNYQAPEGE
jgi:hypothetical protein